VKNKYDLTEGSVLMNLVKFSVPLLLGNLLQAFYSVADTFWVGRFVGKDSLGAMANIVPLVFILVALIMGFTMGTSVLVSQYTGANNQDMVHKTIHNSILVLGISAIIMTIIGIIFSKDILLLMKIKPENMQYALDYLNIYFYGLIFMFGYNLFSAILRGLGDSKTPLIFLAIASILNIVLDPLFIVGWGIIPKMGIKGASVATLISQAISFILSVIYLNRKLHLISHKLSDYRYHKELTIKMVKIGLPTGIQQSLVSLGMMVLVSIINNFDSSDVINAFGVASRIDQFAHLPAQSLSLAVSAYTGQCFGAQKYDKVKDGYKWGVILVVGITSLITLVAYIFPEVIISLFNKDPEVIRIGSRYLRIVGFTYIPFGIMFITNGILRGAGDSVPPLIFTLAALWVVRVPLAKILATPLGPDGVWLAIAISYVITLVFGQTYYFSGRWKKKRVIMSELDPS